MNRRRFLRQALAAGVVCSSGLAGAAARVRVEIDRERELGPIAEDFVGLGYEISSVAQGGLLSATNAKYVRLVKNLGRRGVIRIGGNTSDYARYSPRGQALSAPLATVVNEQCLRELGSFLEAAGWDLIWGLNLGRGSEAQAVEEAQAVMRFAKGRLLAFEIGNEPDLFRKVHRDAGYDYASYLAEYRRFKARLREQIPTIPLAGPDVAAATDWVTRFAADEGSYLRLLTHHYYRECNNPAASCEELLRDDPKLAPELAKLAAASLAAGLPYRICETNSFCGGGKPGVSDSFCSSLWVLDFLCKLAWAGAGGVNLETGLNQLGFVSSYSPIGDDGHGSYSATPEYYGILAFAQSAGGVRLGVRSEAGDLNFASYAVSDKQGIAATFINKDSRAARIHVSGVNGTHAAVLRLAGKDLAATQGVTFGGAAVDEKGIWTPRQAERVSGDAQGCEIEVAAASAAVVRFAV